jgi:4,5-dihydroxyphthalate decarboxylase
MTRTLDIACLPYDRIRPLQDGRVGLDGYTLKFHDMAAGQIPTACFQTGELDIGEVSPANLAMYVEEGGTDYVGLPVFLSRAFRQSYMFVAADSRITKPADLKGGRIGLANWLGTTAIWQRGVLHDEYGVEPGKVSWVMAPEADGGPCAAPPKLAADRFRIDHRGRERGLPALLAAGEVDAILTLRPPAGFFAGTVRRLIENAHAEEVAYYRKTGLFPILHVVTVRKALIDRNPAFAGALFAAFCAARDLAVERVRDYAFQFTTLPWMHHDLEETVAVMGPEYWSYGRKGNDATMETFLRYCQQHAVTGRQVGVDELFPVAVG